MILRCSNSACPWCDTDRELDPTRLSDKCPSCGRVGSVRAGSIGTPFAPGSFKRNERMSRTMAFQPAGIDEIRRDCPSMDFKIKDGEAVPVFHDDKHHRKCMKELNSAHRRYSQERDHREAQKKAAKRKKFELTPAQKRAEVRKWIGKS